MLRERVREEASSGLRGRICTLEGLVQGKTICATTFRRSHSVQWIIKASVLHLDVERAQHGTAKEPLRILTKEQRDGGPAPCVWARCTVRC